MPYLMGCQECTRSVAKVGQVPAGVSTCTKCLPGLFLYQNASTTACVKECSMLAPNLTNDRWTHTCRSCGEGCTRCDEKDGCLSCIRGDSRTYEKTINVQEGPSKFRSFKMCHVCFQDRVGNENVPCRTCDSSTCASSFPGHPAPDSTKGDIFQAWRLPGSVPFPNCMVANQAKSECLMCQPIFFFSAQNQSCVWKVQACTVLGAAPGECARCKVGYGVTLAKSCTDCRDTREAVNPFLQQSIAQCAEGANGVRQIEKCLMPFVLHQVGGQSTCSLFKCPKGQYGQINYDANLPFTESVCQPCASGCEQCTGPTTADCQQCQVGKYFDEQTSNCLNKVVSKLTMDIFVATQNATSLSLEDGSSAKPFSSIFRAVSYAEHMAAKHKEADIKIHLMKGVHYILPSALEFVLSQSQIKFRDSNNIGMSLTILPLQCSVLNSNCHSASTDKVTIKNKAGPDFHFKVSMSLTLKNLIIDSVDSNLLSNYQAKNKECSLLKQDCCALNADQSFKSISGNENCDSVVVSEDTCYFETGVQSMFEFVLNSRRTTANPGQLTLDGVEIRNLFYHIHSIFYVSDPIGKIEVKHVIFDKIRTCGSILTNIHPQRLGTEEAPQSPGPSLLRTMSLRHNYLANPYPVVSVTGCSPSSPCTSLTFLNSTVKQAHFGKGKHRLKNTKSTRTYATFLNLNSYQGPVLIKDCTFQENQINVKDCQITKVQTDIPLESFHSSPQMAPSFDGFIIIVDLKGKVFEMLNNKFIKNSGYQMSMVSIKRTTEVAVIIQDTHFEQNSNVAGTGFIEVFGVTSNCGGVHISNTGTTSVFKQNLNCPVLEPGLIKIRCQAKNESLDLTTATSPQSITYYKNSIELNSLIFQENYFIPSQGVVGISLTTTVLINNDQLTRNGGFISHEVATKYSPFATTMTDFNTEFKDLFNQVYDQDTSLYSLLTVNKLYVNGHSSRSISGGPKTVLVDNWGMFKVGNKKSVQLYLVENVHTISLKHVSFGDLTGVKKVTMDSIKPVGYLTVEDAPTQKLTITKGVSKVELTTVGIHTGLKAIFNQDITLLEIEVIEVNSGHIFYLFSFDKLIKQNPSVKYAQLTIKHCKFTGIHGNGQTTGPISIQKFDITTSITLQNITIDQYGKLNSTSLTNLPFIYVQGILFKHPVTHPTITMQLITCTNSFSTDTVCISLNPQLETTPQKIMVIISDSKFQGNEGKKSCVFMYPSYNLYSVTVNKCVFRGNKGNAFYGADMAFGESNSNGVITVENCEFYAQVYSSLHVQLYGRSLSFVYASQLSRVGYLRHNLFDCEMDMSGHTYEKLVQNGFYENYPGRLKFDTTLVLVQSISIHSTNNTYRNCHSLNAGALTVKLTYLYDTNSKYENLAGFSGGGLAYNEGQGSMRGSIFKNCGANRGGAIYLTFTELEFENVTVTDSFAKLGGAVFAANIQLRGYWDLLSSSFSNNRAVQDGGAVYVAFSDSPNITIRGNKFISNQAERGGIFTVSDAQVAMTGQSEFTNNTASQGNIGMLVKNSKVSVVGATFDSGKTRSQAIGLAQLPYAGHIQITAGSTVTISNCIFNKGYGSKGGAININGDVQATIVSNQFNDNYAQKEGGTITVQSFTKVTLNHNKVTNSYTTLKYKGGDTLFADGFGILEVTNLTVDYSIVGEPMNAVFLEGVKFISDQVKLQVLGSYSYPSSVDDLNLGGGIHAVACPEFVLKNAVISGFKNVQKGGGISIVVLQESQNTDFQHLVQGCQIMNNAAGSYGGGMFVEYIRKLKITSTTFFNNTAGKLNTTKGHGGGLLYASYIATIKPSIEIEQSTHFKQNHATISGGGILWDYYPPTVITNNFTNNSANLYGDDQGSYAQNLVFTSEATYNQVNKKRRELSIGTFPLPGVSSIQSQQSGGLLPALYVAIVDPRNLIVASNSVSSATLKVRPTSSAQSQYGGVVLQGGITQTARHGIFKFDQITLVADPGVQFQFYIESNAIASTLPQNSGSTSNTQISLQVQMRLCQAGEAFLTNGKCQECEAGKEYSLAVLLSVQACKPCVTETMFCLGGSEIGPKPYYWRSSTSSANFIKCLSNNACKGMVAPTMSATGECNAGYEGILCGRCSTGYSSTGTYNCSKCPILWMNIFRLVGLWILAIIVVVLIIKSTISGAAQIKNAQSVYIKILMNHLQLIVLTSSFDFQWPERVLKFFEVTKPAANVSSQFLSVDCLLHELKGKATPAFDIYYQKLAMYAVVPFFMIIVSLVFWRLKICKDRYNKRVGRTVASIIIMLFLIHPSIVQKMFDSFNCMQIDDEQRIISNLDIVCFKSAHLRWSAFISFPSIVIWGIGIPFFASFVLTLNRAKLKKLSVREKYGFLYSGYKKQFYFWETCIMYRKIIIIAISVYLRQTGVVTQALVVFMLLISCLFINVKIQPFSTKAMNDMETYSIISSILTVYCGLFYLSDMPEVYNSSSEEVKVADNGLRLNEWSRLLLFLVIIVSNGLFFMYWIRKFIGEIQNLLRTKFERLYMLIFLCGSKERLVKEKEQRKLMDQNDVLREEFERLLKGLQDLYDSEKLILNPHVLERLSVALNPDKVLKEINYQHNEVFDEQTKQQTKFAKRVNKVKPMDEKEIQTKVDQIRNGTNPYSQMDKMNSSQSRMKTSFLTEQSSNALVNQICSSKIAENEMQESDIEFEIADIYHQQTEMESPDILKHKNTNPQEVKRDEALDHIMEEKLLHGFKSSNQREGNKRTKRAMKSNRMNIEDIRAGYKKSLLEKRAEKRKSQVPSEVKDMFANSVAGRRRSVMVMKQKDDDELGIDLDIIKEKPNDGQEDIKEVQPPRSNNFIVDEWEVELDTQGVGDEKEVLGKNDIFKDHKSGE